MSYILDALRKSEKERQQGSIPTPMTVHETPTRVSINSRHVRLLVSIIIFAAATAVILLSMSKNQARTVLPSVKTPALQPPIASTEHKPSFTVTAQKYSQDSGEHPKIATGVERLKDAVKESGSRQPSSDKVREVLRKDSRIKNPMPTFREADEIAHSVPPASSPVPAPLPVPSPEGSAVAQSALPDPERTYSLSELPLSITQNLPKISVSSLFYSHADPATSIVRINGQQFRNGQDIAPDLKILEILPNSVILSYQSYRFRISLE